MAPWFDDHVCVLMDDSSVRRLDGGETQLLDRWPSARQLPSRGVPDARALFADETATRRAEESAGELGDGGRRSPYDRRRSTRTAVTDGALV